MVNYVCNARRFRDRNGNERRKHSQSEALQGGVQNTGIGGEITKRSQLRSRETRGNDFFENLLVGLLPGWPGIILHAPTDGGRCKANLLGEFLQFTASSRRRPSGHARLPWRYDSKLRSIQRRCIRHRRGRAGAIFLPGRRRKENLLRCSPTSHAWSPRRNRKWSCGS